MTGREPEDQSARRPVVKVSVEREQAPQFGVGTRWEVAALSLESLWHGPYTVTLRQVEPRDDTTGFPMKERDVRPAIGRIERRAIEARAVAPVVKAIERRVGREDALALLTEANQQEAFDRGRAVAEHSGRNGIDELVEDVAGWGAGGSMEMVVLERTPTTFFFNVTRCPYSETYKGLGMEELGVALSCCRDEPFARGLNPRLRLDRTQTIMEGADHCDFRYRLEQVEAGTAGEGDP